MSALTASSLFTSSSLRASKSTTSTSKELLRRRLKEKPTSFVARKNNKRRQHHETVFLSRLLRRMNVFGDRSQDKRIAAAAAYRDWADADDCRWCFRRCGYRRDCPKAMKENQENRLGAPASGKGTQCELIVKKFGITHISAA